MTNTQPRGTYDAVATIIHWVIALLLIPMLFFGEELMEAEGGGTFLPSLHVSIGVSIFVLSIIRLAWRIGHPAPAAPATRPAWEAVASRLSHFAFYVLMIGLPVTGWLALPPLLAKEPAFVGTSMFGFSVPMAPDFGLPAGGLHNLGSKIGIALLILHVAAALKHHFINRDDVLTRMLPGHQ